MDAIHWIGVTNYRLLSYLVIGKETHLAIVRTATVLNWQTIGVLSAMFFGFSSIFITLFIFMINRRENRSDKRNSEIRDEIANAVNHLSEILLAKLETKETVAQISIRLARLEGSVKSIDTNDG